MKQEKKPFVKNCCRMRAPDIQSMVPIEIKVGGVQSSLNLNYNRPFQPLLSLDYTNPTDVAVTTMKGIYLWQIQ